MVFSLALKNHGCKDYFVRRFLDRTSLNSVSNRSLNFFLEVFKIRFGRGPGLTGIFISTRASTHFERTSSNDPLGSLVTNRRQASTSASSVSSRATADGSSKLITGSDDSSLSLPTKGVSTCLTTKYLRDVKETTGEKPFSTIQSYGRN